MTSKPKTADLPELTRFELEIMQAVWELGNATAAEVGKRLDRTLADTTIHTVLANLRKKGYVAPVPTIERALRFAPCVPREQVATRSLRRLLGDFFDGSPLRLMAHLKSEEAVDAKELREIAEMLQQDKKPRGRTRK
jgi:predicted transcriptional regulator